MTVSTRVRIASLAFVACGQALGADPVPQREPPTVLFVCERGGVKSLLGKLLFEREAAAAGLEVRAESRGVDPYDAVPDWMRSALRTDGFDIGTWKPARVGDEDLLEADYLVTFDIELPQEESLAARAREWDGLPPVSKDYAAGRDAIQARVRELVRELLE